MSGGICGQVHAIPHPGAPRKAEHPTPVLMHGPCSAISEGQLGVLALGLTFRYVFVPLQVMSKLFMVHMQQCGFTAKLRGWKASSEVNNFDPEGKI